MSDQKPVEPQDEVQDVQKDQEESPPEAQPEGEPQGDPEAEGEAAVRQVADEEKMSDKDADEAMMAMLEDLPESGKTSPDDIKFDSAEVADAEFQHLSEPAAKPAPRNIGLLMDVNLPIAIELGRTKMSISDILALGPGSVVELNKLAGEPVDVLVNGKIVARGEVVVIDENFGVRIVQLMTPEQRLKLLSDEQ